MFVVCVNIWVKPDAVEEFIEATLENARQTRQEPENQRFDVLQGHDDPCRFFFYEVYTNADAFADHQKTGHYLTWRQTVADWMAEPRHGIKFNSLFPAEAEWKA